MLTGPGSSNGGYRRLEGIGIERDLAGLPVIYAPPDLDIWDENNTQTVSIRMGLEAMVQNIRRDAHGGSSPPGRIQAGTSQFWRNTAV